MSRPIVVRDAATTVLLRDEHSGAANGLEVLLLRRHANHVFGANAYVFPGGAIDAADRDPALVARCAGQTGALARTAVMEKLAAPMAAIRECFEEAGLLVGCAVGHDDPAQCDALRVALNEQTQTWPCVAEALDLTFTLEELVYFAHWTTPIGPPKRYATRFFAAAAPAGDALCDGCETTHAWWVTPTTALNAWSRGDIELMEPTSATLASLRGYASTAAALDALAAGTVRYA